MTRGHRSRTLSAWLAAVLAACLLLAGCGGERGGTQSTGGTGGRLSIATGNTTGVYYQLGGGLAALISQNVPGYQATAEATGASVENIRRVVAGQSDIAFTLADTAADAVNGTGSFQGKQPIRALTRLYTNYTQVFIRADSGIRTIADMKGKTVSTGSPNSGTEVIAVRLLQAAGLSTSDITQRKLSLPETVQGMKDGQIQALFWSGGLPTAGITDLTSTMKDKVRALDLSPYLAKLQQTHGQVYAPATIPASAYGLSADVPTIGVPNLLVVKEDMPEDLAYRITKVIFEKKAELEKVHPEAKNITHENAPKTEPVPLHPGAKRYLDEAHR
jgi:TRAP transporter TAXI family solute receptor